MVQMNRFLGQKLRPRCREQTYGHQGGEKVMTGKNLQPRLLYPARISFRFNGESKTFTDKHKRGVLWLDWNFIFKRIKWTLFYFFIQQVLISQQFYTHQCIHAHPNLPIHHSTTTTTLPLSPSWCPYVCSLRLCLSFCPANRFICTIFLGSTYMPVSYTHLTLPTKA